MDSFITEINLQRISKMRNRIEQFERAANGLEPSAGIREIITGQALEFAETFLEKLPELNTFEKNRGRSKPLDQPFTEEVGDFPDLLETLDTTVLSEGIQPASGGHMGYGDELRLIPGIIPDYSGRGNPRVR